MKKTSVLATKLENLFVVINDMIQTKDDVYAYTIAMIQEAFEKHGESIKIDEFIDYVEQSINEAKKHRKKVA
ncbi:MAG: hypothetical protein A2381_01525 [Bdellovibrionales bacterium RIFOXYB1_FULL_37_110]|nr:MAG: hypothetical protein A2417_02380 [Bdellovibrionales bacterium RIFOXYC1_FULL_37_79]OFZ58896.1 MAG: hypothetical protein A2381_01525 [Bdellovibrionales bacterium RIFOXYB1_FULL_37_110]OFZ64658.1 MAG: hypothetical protein A2577_13410 [Bdellovibrionales bacterium RIFOXYD1_FULL_36_51]